VTDDPTMKIALITIHYANSYGGCLQALASQSVLSRYGEVSIIDYKTPTLATGMSLIRFSSNPRSILHVIKDLCRIFPRRRLLAKFKAFMAQYYLLTSRCDDSSDLEALNDKYDIFICGSDQIWNPSVTGGLDLNYLLAFVKDKPRVAFSTSAGSYVFDEVELGLVKKAVMKFNFLAFREMDTVQSLKVVNGRDDIECTIDPTLLLDRYEWRSLLGLHGETSKDSYILVYGLKKNCLVYDVAKKISLHLGLKLVAVDQDPFLVSRVDNHLQDASPVDFVSLIDKADFVVTNSFHGTAFAVNFGIPFLSIKPDTGFNRIKCFLEDVGLEGRIVESLDTTDTELALDINFQSAHRRLAALREKSFTFLNKVFS
tara:strand:+ start:528233 stop:529345 length:1113 start_codon:yes stop_codon:yes gene_type:complete